jgi:hypothetical protein
VVKALLREQCDLWIFPSQDARGFQFPVPALVSIHDLMHRYERRFPESASKWEYLNREHTYTNICRWAKGVLVDSETGRQQVAESYGMPSERIHVLPYIAPSTCCQGRTPDLTRYRLPENSSLSGAFWAHRTTKLINNGKLKMRSRPEAGTVRDET